jgi:hypothetical protein
MSTQLHKLGWHTVPAPHALLQFTAPAAFSPHAQEQVSGSSVRVGPQSCCKSHVHAQLAASKTKPAAQVVVASHTHAHACASQRSPAPQPPHAGAHSTVHVDALQRSGNVGAVASPHVAGHV